MIIAPPNITWAEEKIPTEINTYLFSQIAKAQHNYKPKLVGHISKSLELPDEEGIFTRYLLDKCKQLYWAKVTKLDNLWVNFQNKHEYNPYHQHNGQVSFVLWMKIPYKREDEEKTEIAKNTNSRCMNGAFEITFMNLLGVLANYAYFLDPSYEKYLIMFPSETRHCVYPFYTSNEERISISGNLI
jgi:hypothetical protein